MADDPRTVLLCRDLIFVSRTTAAARAVGAGVRVVRDPAKLGEAPGEKLIVDLAEPGFLDAATQWKAATGGVVIGFVSHVDEETIRRARAAGIDQVLTRGTFSRVVEGLFR